MAAAVLAAIMAGQAAACTSPRLMQLETTLAANDSATAALGQWCAVRGFADPPAITAAPVKDGGAAEPGDARQLLDTPPGQPLGYRHVRLACGNLVLSEAHNWYVPARLTPLMNAALAQTDTPFGKVVSSLHFTRERLASQRGRGPGCPAGTVLTHRALLRLQGGLPLALVVECYTRANLGRGRG